MKPVNPDHREVAVVILRAFERYREQFNQVTLGARDRFLEAKWAEVERAARERIGLYKKAKSIVCTQLIELADREQDWRGIRSAYAHLVSDRTDAALAGTFYNTVFRALNHRKNLDDAHAFVSANPPGSPETSQDASPAMALTRTFSGPNVGELVRQVLLDSGLGQHLADLDADCAHVHERLLAQIPLLRHGDARTDQAIAVEIINRVFYRNKGAYLVGSLLIDEHVIPLALALRHEDGDIAVDAVLWGEARLSVVFSFTRSYFMVDTPEPSRLVDYLQRLLPAKKRSELYTSLGFYKQGKTQFVRGYRAHLAVSDDKFVIAEGIRGQVMMVFGLPSYQIVFKIMKDRFPATKQVNHEDVRQAYQLVKTHDRVGRMADTQEFHFFEFPRERFEPALLDELLAVAGESVELRENTVVVRHLYAERMMTPLNLYLQNCSEFQLRQVISDYGAAVRELAAANIFPGDMLLKNFGVTRHSRVVFYDYDEICYLTDVNFRELPDNARGPGGEAWFDVGEYDVFPEEFATFLFPDQQIRAIFEEQHADLFTAEGWRHIQAQVRDRVLVDVYPYPDRARLLADSV